MDNPDDLNIDNTGSSPESEYDSWWALTHKNTKASWDVAESDDTDEVVEDSYTDLDEM
jgi:hypothetical protein